MLSLTLNVDTLELLYNKMRTEDFLSKEIQLTWLHVRFSPLTPMRRHTVPGAIVFLSGFVNYYSHSVIIPLNTLLPKD